MSLAVRQSARAAASSLTAAHRLAVALVVAVALAACGDADPAAAPDAGDAPAGPRLGAHPTADDAAVEFAIYSAPATRIELWIYDAPMAPTPALVEVLEPVEGVPGVWSVRVARDALAAALGDAPLYYGYRAWGPNWPYAAAWTPGSSEGFRSDVDVDGNRFDPNKLLVDPYARELSHDPKNPDHQDGTVYASGQSYRALDSGPVAPKGIYLGDQLAEPADLGPRPERAFRDEVIYEVHVRGLTMLDPEVPAELRGTYAGAAHKADALAELGVTAIELLPIHETQNDQNDLEVGTAGDNYWGYATLGYFAPDRRYAADRSPGGPTRELQAMVRAFHQRGIKVYLDVVYNHTGEGGPWDGTGDVADLLSWRGLDNATYYELTADGRFYVDTNGVAGNVNVAAPVVRDLVIDSLAYWHREIGIDGFRFDLASVLGNRCQRDCFDFDGDDPDGILMRAPRELPARPDDGGAGVDLIAEPWGIGVYHLGRFPVGWAEWNGQFRDTVRSVQNERGMVDVSAGILAARLAGSPDLYGDDGRRPAASVDFVVAHDGFTLADLYRCNGKDNGQAWPHGPSDGGESHNRSWDQGGDPAAQRQAARTGLALLAVSGGVPMILGGDESLRSQRCNNNTYNLDSPGNWLSLEETSFTRFTRGVFALRAAHAAARPTTFVSRAWLAADGGPADLAAPIGFLAFEQGDLYVAYNASTEVVRAHLAGGDGAYTLRVDTAAWLEGADNLAASVLPADTYDLAPRSLVILERTAP